MKRVFLIIATLFCLVSCGVSGGDSENKTAENFIGHMELDYADQFSVDYISENISLITIGEEKYILTYRKVSRKYLHGIFLRYGLFQRSGRA